MLYFRRHIDFVENWILLPSSHDKICMGSNEETDFFLKFYFLEKIEWQAGAELSQAQISFKLEAQ